MQDNSYKRFGGAEEAERKRLRNLNIIETCGICDGKGTIYDPFMRKYDRCSSCKGRGESFKIF